MNELGCDGTRTGKSTTTQPISCFPTSRALACMGFRLARCLFPQYSALAGILLFRNIPPLRARDSVWHVCPGELLSRFCGQTEWRGRCRLSRGGRCVSFSKRQAATINRITVGTEISEKPPPFRLATLHYRKNPRLYELHVLTKWFFKYGPNGTPYTQEHTITEKDYLARARNDVHRTRRDAKFCISTTLANRYPV